MKTSVSRRILVLVATVALVLAGIALPASAAKGGNGKGRGAHSAEQTERPGKGRGNDTASATADEGPGRARGRSGEAKNRQKLRFTAKGEVAAPAVEEPVEEPVEEVVGDGAATVEDEVVGETPVEDGSTEGGTDQTPVEDGSTEEGTDQIPVEEGTPEGDTEEGEEGSEAAVTVTFDPARGTKNVRKLDALTLTVTDATKIILYGERTALADAGLSALPPGTRIVAKGWLDPADGATGVAKKLIVKAPKVVEDDDDAEDEAEGGSEDTLEDGTEETVEGGDEVDTDENTAVDEGEDTPETPVS